MKKSKKISQKIHNFTAIFEPAEEGGYVVTVPALPGCATQGETFEEATVMIQDAVQLYVKSLRDLKEEIPIESENVVISKVPVRI